MRCHGLLLGLALVESVCLAQDFVELDLDHRVRSEFVTPHTDWAAPYALGKTRVLFFLRGHDTEPREVIELQQRFEFEPEMVFWTRIIDSSDEHWHGDERGLQRMARLLAQKWDVFVFLSPGPTGVRDVIPDMLPVELQYRMLQAVTEGAGLVVVGADDNFCRLCERFGQTYRHIDPASRCGFEGAGTFTRADDLDGFVRSNGFWSPYPGTADEVVRSIAPRDFPRSNWMGYTKDPDSPAGKALANDHPRQRQRLEVALGRSRTFSRMAS